MSKADALLVVWEPTTGKTLEEVELRAIPTVGGNGNDQIVVTLDQDADLIVPPEWVGKQMHVEVSPKAVTSDPMTQAIVSLAGRMGVPVG